MIECVYVYGFIEVLSMSVFVSAGIENTKLKTPDQRDGEVGGKPNMLGTIAPYVHMNNE